MASNWSNASQTRCRQLPVAVITAYGNVETAVASAQGRRLRFHLQAGGPQVLRNLVGSALKVQRHSFPRHDQAPAGTEAARRIAGHRATRATIVKLARSQAPIYISGESGSGKELVGAADPRERPARRAPFVPVNCGAIPRS